MVDKRRRVVVTGLGALSPVGNSASESWEAVVAGRSGVATDHPFRSDRLRDPIRRRSQGLRSGRDPRQEGSAADGSPRPTRRGCGARSRGNAGLDRRRIGPVPGRRADRVPAWARWRRSSRAPRRCSTRDRAGSVRSSRRWSLPNMAAGMAAIFLGAKGPCLGTVSACASLGPRDRRGRRDDPAWRGRRRCIAGGAEAPVTRLGRGRIRRDGRPVDPKRRPERREPAIRCRSRRVRARRRRRPCWCWRRSSMPSAAGRTMLAEVAGYAATDDANHMVQPAPGGEGAARAMRLALRRAGLRRRTSATSMLTGRRPRSTRNSRRRRSSRRSATRAYACRSARRNR